jgi:hypothetical protein
MTIERRLFGLAAFAVAALAGQAARADDRAAEFEACAQAANRAQPLRRDGKLKAARADLVRCAQASCPKDPRNDCTTWLGEVDQELPSIVVRATDASGRDLVDVHVEARGETLTDHLDGSAISIDPGNVTLRVHAAGLPEQELALVVARGEKARVVKVTFGAPKRAAPVASASPDATGSTAGRPPSGSALPWVLLGTGAASLATFGVLEAIAQPAYADMKNGCAITMSCKPARVATTRAEFVAAGIAFGAGLTLGAAAVVYWIAAPSRPARSGSRARPVLALGVAPLSARVAGSF